MRQPPDDYEDLDRYHDQDDEDEDLEEFGTPVYQGTGLSVRALTAEEFQRSLDAHAAPRARRPPPPAFGPLPAARCRGAGRLDLRPGLAGANGRHHRPRWRRARSSGRYAAGRAGGPRGRGAGRFGAG